MKFYSVRDCELKVRLGGETRAAYVIMHKAYCPLTSCTSVTGSSILWFSASKTLERFKEEHLKDKTKIGNQILLKEKKEKEARGVVQNEL